MRIKPDAPKITPPSAVDNTAASAPAATPAPPADPMAKRTYCIWTGEAFGDVVAGQLIAVAPLAAERLRNDGRARYATADEARDRAAAAVLTDI